MIHLRLIQSIALTGLTLLVASACATDESVEPATVVATGAGPSAPWTLESAEVDSLDGLRVLVLHDMEGLSGQDDWRTFAFQHPEHYARGQELLAADLNAVIDGLFAGGATEVLVVDGHGSGNPDPDVRADLLDPRAVQILRDEPFDTYFDLPESESLDAVAVVGMHAKTGSGGFASHTYTLGIELQVNDRSITETELVGLSWGRVGVPVIFASGDDRLATDLETMPWIEYVRVKTATSASTAELRPVEEARADLRAGAQRAIKNLAGAQTMRVTRPIRTTVRAVPPASLRVLDGVPGVDFDSESDQVTYEAYDLRSMYDQFESLVAVATRAYSGVLWETIEEAELPVDVRATYNDALMVRWLDVESDRWQPAAPVSSADARKYHGYE